MGPENTEIDDAYYPAYFDYTFADPYGLNAVYVDGVCVSGASIHELRFTSDNQLSWNGWLDGVYYMQPVSAGTYQYSLTFYFNPTSTKGEFEVTLHECHSNDSGGVDYNNKGTATVVNPTMAGPNVTMGLDSSGSPLNTNLTNMRWTRHL